MADDKIESLLAYMENQTTCLNVAGDSPNALKNLPRTKQRVKDSSLPLLSNDDPQLLLNVHFNQAVRLRKLIIHTAEAHISQGPALVKLFVNRPTIDFEEAENEGEPQAVQVIELTQEQVQSGEPISLRFAMQFQKVSTLQIFVQSNFEDGDVTRIDALDLLGTPTLGGGARDLSGLHKEEDS
ncbi:hypothetical protein EIP91_012160 [Steccherinum ochraceum]|uniref:PITH domain-containing protein n=1 Tax=Steccherinum ochraceum TaxID=92696 RepID=A0A4R0RGT8_9APHY|nr:hypothetical protein EIP91_012160 [Steccherinum ochraceum]